MARKPSNTSPTPATAEVTSTEESIVTTTTEAPVEAVAETTEATPTETVIDLSDFNTALAAAIEGADGSTGDVPVALVEPVVLAYRKLDGAKAKNAAKKSVDEAMKGAMDKSDVPTARANLQISKKLTAGPVSSGPKAERTPVDPTDAFVELVAGLSLAAGIVQSQVPEGVGEGWQEKAQAKATEGAAAAQAYLVFLNTTVEEGAEAPVEPEVPAFVKAAVKLALGKSAKVGSAKKAPTGTSTYEGERRDVGAHISSAFEGVESGTFLTIAEIRKHESAEYGKDSPSAGAISARLFPKSGKVSVEGVTPSTNDKGIKGAVKN